MRKGRLEAFSDGVIAILITIMVFDLKAPDGSDSNAIWSLIPGVMTYLLSFIYLAIYWNNHHHLLLLADRISGPIMWANMHLLFWLSLIPFGTAWMHKSEFASLPVAIYGVVLLACSIAWWVLQTTIILQQGNGSPLRKAIGSDLKGKASAVLYLVAVFFAFAVPAISMAIYVGVAVIWLVPDRRFECAVSESTD